jgi:UDP-glucose 4-epimerase
MKKVIFFGSEGYLGSHLVSQLLPKNYLVKGYDVHDNSKHHQLHNYQKIDVSNKLDIERIDFNVDFVYYFSGLTGTDISIGNYDKFIDINEKGLLNVLTTIKNKGFSPKIIFPSTRLVYKGLKNKPLVENDPKEFKTIYALNKFHNENVLKMFKTYFNIPYTVFRICVPYGNLLSKDYSYGTIGFFLKKAQVNQPISLYGDGDLKRTFSFVGDICDQIIQVSEAINSNGEAYNIGGETYSLLEVATIVANKFNVDVEHIDWPPMALAQESGDTIFNSNKIEKISNQSYNSLTSWINKI